MQSVLRETLPGLGRMIVLSFFIHAIVLSAIFFFIKPESRKFFPIPVYTTVEIVAQSVKTEEKASEEAKPAIKIKKGINEKTNLVKKKPKRLTVPKEKVSVKKAIEDIEKKVKRKEEDELVEIKIKKMAKGIEERPDSVKGELESLREEILKNAPKDVAVKAAVPKAAENQKGSQAMTAELFELKFKAYYNTVGQMIQSAWTYPGEAKKGQQVWLSIKIRDDGILEDVRVEKKSGSVIFDESALRAVKKAAPFPPLPEEIKGKSLEIGVRFCPGGCA